MEHNEFYQINAVSDITITLVRSDPSIVRRIEVLSDISLLELHFTIHFAMGWTNSHLFQFTRGDLYFGLRYNETEDEFPDLIDAFGVQLAGVLKRPGQILNYLYDFGDGWEHKIQLNRHIAQDQNKKYPFCISGEGNCPPEDCGGIYGFYNMLKILNDPNDPEHKVMKRWVGKKYDPDEFDISKTNTRLRRVKSYIKAYSRDRYLKQFLGK